eukprot:TRINITY_DN7608_c0_g1_i1.p1 TRINITY_DN7608_c0_g1~~TRINITY_DN7608_c0_g1_i1.p1  ORF type:complete len:356 (+),score=78.42 TRINITY_DN7608_c0_g1_i1:116-1183(+)
MSDNSSEVIIEQRQFERSNRGKYIKEKTEEELEADNDFWAQAALAEEEEDVKYETEEEPEDIVDSDFDRSENDNVDDDEGGKQVDVKEKKVANKKKSSKYLETIPGMKKAIALLRKKKKAEKDKQEQEKLRQKDPQIQVQQEQESDFEDDIRSSSKGRKRSRKSANKLSISEIERLEEMEYSKSKKQKKRKSLVSKKMSIRQVMREAANTEWDNLASLEQLMAREEEVKKKAVVERKEAQGPVMRVRSSIINGEERSTISLINCEETPDLLQPQYGPQMLQTHVCAVTQKPAKYLDPITKTPFANLQAYKILYPDYHKESRQIQYVKSFNSNFVRGDEYSDQKALDTLANMYLQQ